jgi:ABC-type multidrug transport system fused ATPase/permease subunit
MSLLIQTKRASDENKKYPERPLLNNLSNETWTSNETSHFQIDLNERREYYFNYSSNKIKLLITLGVFKMIELNFYKVIVCLVVAFAFFRSVLFFLLCIRSSKNLHKNMFVRVMSTPIRFFDTNPIGRIINRFSKDIGIIDETIPISVMLFMKVIDDLSSILYK